MRLRFFYRLRFTLLPNGHQRLLMTIIFLTASGNLFCLAGCSTLPKAGPSTSEVAEQAKTEQRNFDLIE